MTTRDEGAVFLAAGGSCQISQIFSFCNEVLAVSTAHLHHNHITSTGTHQGDE